MPTLNDTTRIVLNLPDPGLPTSTLTFLWPLTTPLPIVGDWIRLPPSSPVQGSRQVKSRLWEIEYDDRRHCARPVLSLALSHD